MEAFHIREAAAVAAHSRKADQADLQSDAAAAAAGERIRTAQVRKGCAEVGKDVAVAARIAAVLVAACLAQEERPSAGARVSACDPVPMRVCTIVLTPTMAGSFGA